MNIYEKMITSISEISRSREVMYTVPRFGVFYKLVKIDNIPVSVVAKMSGFTHAAIINAVNRFEGWLSVNDRLAISAWEKIKELDF